ncbi:class I SAM-dependent methyltransferase [Sphingomonas sabuli]|uniref:Class I SAM-dependent methyltransferase n=1 Tax=Sphingomonas sabuli TaxID=2764186 RepID=A0A7G9L5B5_9SPHN|nr:class I SAM-dependent methyltransferase [Sphingomonas sabuli]QNM83814.1 class I SAM-dependent methyltransferase [Sphingomonas sabuli]
MSDKIDLSPYDFVDFGCSVGGSMTFAQKAFRGGRPIGIDIDPKKVERTREAGFDAVLADATDPDQFTGQVRFAILSHFLEHLPDFDLVSKALRTAIHISSDFVFIRQPWFDDDGLLFRNGLKYYWSDWRGHPMTLTTLQMYRALRPHLDSGKIARATIFGNTPVLDTDDDSVVPLWVPLDTGKYDPEIHGPKLTPPLELEGYRELVVVIAKSDPDITGTLLSKFPRIRMINDEFARETPIETPVGDAVDEAAEEALLSLSDD